MVVVVVVERMCRRTSAGIAVPATTPIKISRPDVNYRLESFAPKDREKRVKDYIGMTKKQNKREPFVIGKIVVAVEMATEMRKKIDISLGRETTWKSFFCFLSVHTHAHKSNQVAG